MTEVIVVGIAFALVGFVFLFGWFLSKIYDVVWDIKSKKHRAKYPHLYELYKARDRYYTTLHNIRIEKYFTPKQKIDSLMKNARYFPKAKRNEIYTELERLRQTIADHYAEIRPIEDEIERVEQQIEDYKKLHKIKKVY